MTNGKHAEETATGSLEAMLNELLAREVSATDAYRLAIALFQGRLRVKLLEDIANHHADAARFFRDYLVETGGRIRTAAGSVFRSEWPKANPDAPTASIIAALREGEFTTLQDHQCVLHDHRITEEIRHHLRDVLIPRGTLHLDALDMFAQIDPR